MKQILDNLLSLGRTRLLILGGVGLGGIVALLFGLSVVTAPEYGTLYSQLSPGSAASMVDALDKAGITTKVSSDGTSVSVPKPDIARARMALAEKGLPQDGEPGWELFDNTERLRHEHLHAAGEPAARDGGRAGPLDPDASTGCDGARVHLVLPERAGVFAQPRPTLSASVIVRAAPATASSRRQALAIRNLIAAAVPNMSAEPGHRAVGQRRDDPGREFGRRRGRCPLARSVTRSALEDRMARNIEADPDGAGRRGQCAGAGHRRPRPPSVRWWSTSKASTPISRSSARPSHARGEGAGQQGHADEVGVAANLPRRACRRPRRQQRQHATPRPRRTSRQLRDRQHPDARPRREPGADQAHLGRGAGQRHLSTWQPDGAVEIRAAHAGGTRPG